MSWLTQITTAEQKAAVEAYQETSCTQERSGAYRSGEGQDRRIHRRLCDQSGERRESADLDRRLCAWPVTVQARSWRFPAMMSATGNSRSSSICRSSKSCKAEMLRRKLMQAMATHVNSDFLNGLNNEAGDCEDDRMAGGRTAKAKAKSPTVCATGCSAASAIGASRFRSFILRTAR